MRRFVYRTGIVVHGTWSVSRGRIDAAIPVATATMPESTSSDVTVTRRCAPAITPLAIAGKPTTIHAVSSLRMARCAAPRVPRGTCVRRLTAWHSRVLPAHPRIRFVNAGMQRGIHPPARRPDASAPSNAGTQRGIHPPARRPDASGAGMTTACTPRAAWCRHDDGLHAPELSGAGIPGGAHPDSTRAVPALPAVCTRPDAPGAGIGGGTRGHVAGCQACSRPTSGAGHRRRHARPCRVAWRAPAASHIRCRHCRRRARSCRVAWRAPAASHIRCRHRRRRARPFRGLRGARRKRRAAD